MPILTGSVSGLSMNGGSRALNASYAGKVPFVPVLAAETGHWAAIHRNFDFGLLMAVTWRYLTQ